MSSWLLSSTLNYQPYPNVQLLIQQYIQLPAVYSHPAVYSAVYSITSQSQIHIELRTRAQCTAGYSTICETTSCIFAARSSFSSIFNSQQESNVQRDIQQDIELPARALCTAGCSAVHFTASYMYIWLLYNQLHLVQYAAE